MGLGLVILIFGIFALTEISRRVENKEVTDVDRHQVGKKKAEMMTIGKAPKFSFTDQHGNIISNATFKDKVYVLDFIFTTCPSICPIMTKNMVTVQNAFNNKPIGIVSITINPENDTPEVLKAYAEEYGVTNPVGFSQLETKKPSISWRMKDLICMPVKEINLKEGLNIQECLHL